MAKQFIKIVETDKTAFFRFLHQVAAQEQKMLIRGNLIAVYQQLTEQAADNGLARLEDAVNDLQESVCIQNTIFLEVRETVAISDYFLFNLETLDYRKVEVKEFLRVRELCKNPAARMDILSVNFKPFYEDYPSVRQPKYIGSGMEYLNRYLSSQMFNDPDNWRRLLFQYLQLHQWNAEPLMLNDRITSEEQLIEQVDKALQWLKKQPEAEPYARLKHHLQELGFEKGLGATAGKIADTLKRLGLLLESPDHENLKVFLSGIPMIFNILIVSVHGYFAQEGVLGLPDTGGQVVYILDQVKALEKAMIRSIKDAGLNAVPKILILSRLIPEAGATTCAQKLEKVHGTRNVWILRVPFRAHNTKLTDRWISRFEIYPYLEEFAEDAYHEVLANFERRPDLVIGNYTDGNLVATILARKFGVTQCGIAHALEKSKYLYSALYWKELEETYHFSLQFTSDLIAMNAADFLITSTYQEIAGTETTIGQYESYKAFSLPDLYRVESGINLFHPKFNVVSPGVNEKVYFPYTKTGNRIVEMTADLADMLFGSGEDPDVRGNLKYPERTPVFTMARLDKIKNLTALVEWYGQCPELQERANLIVVAGTIHPDRSSDREERDQIQRMHDLIDHYHLQDHIRWIGKLFRKDEAGEVYRLIADRRGIFVQPALFEGFGLTVIEAMISGLPVFATQYGGPLEIIEDGKSGFHIDPIDGKASIEKILAFVKAFQKDSGLWQAISKKAITRVQEKYNWDLYSERLLSLARIYGFWRFSLNLDHSEMYAYLDVLYYLLYKPMARRLLDMHDSR